MWYPANNLFILGRASDLGLSAGKRKGRAGMPRQRMRCCISCAHKIFESHAIAMGASHAGSAEFVSVKRGPCSSSRPPQIIYQGTSILYVSVTRGNRGEPRPRSTAGQTATTIQSTTPAQARRRHQTLLETSQETSLPPACPWHYLLSDGYSLVYQK